MRRQWIMAVTVVGALVVGGGLVVWAGAQGLLSPQGKGKRILVLADRDMQHGQLAEAQAKLDQFLSTFADSPWADEALFKLGQVHEQEQQPLEAKAAYQQLLDRFPRSALLGQAESRLGAVNLSLLFSPKVTDHDVSYVVKPGDTLGGIAQANHTTAELIRKANGITGDVIWPNQTLKIPKASFGIVVDKSENQLLVTRDNQFFKTYTVSTGKDNSTPVGTFKIVNKIVNPVWYKQGAIVPPDSQENVLGTRWMGFDKPSYGIHGTTDPTAIGKQVTAGCVRMTNAEVEELFSIVPIGTDVTIVD